jgi:hypothetical protein
LQNANCHRCLYIFRVTSRWHWSYVGRYDGATSCQRTPQYKVSVSERRRIENSSGGYLDRDAESERSRALCVTVHRGICQFSCVRLKTPFVLAGSDQTYFAGKLAWRNRRNMVAAGCAQVYGSESIRSTQRHGLLNYLILYLPQNKSAGVHCGIARPHVTRSR